jgi:hypothetical protein
MPASAANFREGTDLWIVWNERINAERDIAGQHRRPASAGRTPTLKYTRTLAW